MKIQKKKLFGGGVGLGGRVVGLRGWERRIEAFVKIQKKNSFERGEGGGRRRVWVRVDVNREVQFL